MNSRVKDSRVQRSGVINLNTLLSSPRDSYQQFISNSIKNSNQEICYSSAGNLKSSQGTRQKVNLIEKLSIDPQLNTRLKKMKQTIDAIYSKKAKRITSTFRTLQSEYRTMTQNDTESILQRKTHRTLEHNSHKKSKRNVSTYEPGRPKQAKKKVNKSKKPNRMIASKGNKSLLKESSKKKIKSAAFAVDKMKSQISPSYVSYLLEERLHRPVGAQKKQKPAITIMSYFKENSARINSSSHTKTPKGLQKPKSQDKVPQFQAKKKRQSNSSFKEFSKVKINQKKLLASMSLIRNLDKIKLERLNKPQPSLNMNIDVEKTVPIHMAKVAEIGTIKRRGNSEYYLPKKASIEGNYRPGNQEYILEADEVLEDREMLKYQPTPQVEETQRDNEFQSDNNIFFEFWEKEHRERVDLQKIESHQKQIKWRMRSILIDWIVEVCRDYQLTRDSFYYAARYLDFFLSSAKGIRKVDFQLVGLTCLFIATKMEEIVPPLAKELSYFASGLFSEQDLISMEMRIVQVLI